MPRSILVCGVSAQPFIQDRGEKNLNEARAVQLDERGESLSRRCEAGEMHGREGSRMIPMDGAPWGRPTLDPPMELGGSSGFGWHPFRTVSKVPHPSGCFFVGKTCPIKRHWGRINIDPNPGVSPPLFFHDPPLLPTK